jgi:hypothetical protein
MLVKMLWTFFILSVQVVMLVLGRYRLKKEGSFIKLILTFAFIDIIIIWIIYFAS